MLKSDMNDSYPCPDRQLRVKAHGKQLELYNRILFVF